MKSNTKIIGALSGFVNGLFGSGGGMICVPSLVKSGVEQHMAQATTLSVILPLSILSGIAYAFKCGITWYTLFTALGALPGGWLGAKLMGKIPGVWLSRIFALLMLFAGLRMLFV